MPRPTAPPTAPRRRVRPVTRLAPTAGMLPRMPAPHAPERRPFTQRAATFLRSALAGGAATLADLATLGLLVGFAGLTPRAANVPALLAGALVQFVGNRHFAFRAASGSLRRQLALFAVTEAVALALNAALYHAAAALAPPGVLGAVALRAVTTNLVFVFWSYPVWRRVFRPAEPAAAG